MAVLKKIRSRLWAPPAEEYVPEPQIATPVAVSARYDIRPLTISNLDDCWRLDQRCFVDGELTAARLSNTFSQRLNLFPIEPPLPTARWLVSSLA
jgi:hypothetical protein